MRVLYKESPRTVAIYSTNHSLLFQQIKNNRDNEPVVAIELVNNDEIKHDPNYRPLINRDVFGCLGLINVDNQSFLAVITGAVVEVAKPVNYESVDRIYSVQFISLSRDTWDFANLDSNGMPIPLNATVEEDGEYEGNPYSHERHPCVELIRLLSSGSFYYSNDFDLTSLLQNRGVNHELLNSTSNHGNNKINLQHYLEQYMWNSFIMDQLLQYRSNLDQDIQAIMDENKFLTTVIRGFAKTTRLNRLGDSITIISKQSWKRAGTRFNVRGIDDSGNVANFVESEFIYNHASKNSIFSFIQIRGSVPAFWEQDATLINPKITLTRSVEATQPIFNAHFQDICSKYGVCHIINLLSKTKPAEIPVLNRYKQLYNHCDRYDELRYTEFDFHQQTKVGGFAAATKILSQLNDSLERFGWFVYDGDLADVVTRQDGVFRVNCLDCLDRTNLIEQVICQHVLENIINNETQDMESSYQSRFELQEVMDKYNALWADNGDAISQIYTGTNALKSSFSRSGKMNLAGALSDVTKSVSRMYQNTFVDNRKQSTLDLLLGYDSKNCIPVRIYDPVNEYVQDKLKLQEQSFTSYSNISLFTGTFNVNAALPDARIDLTPWLFPASNLNTPLADIYAIGLQELIELNAGSILNADTTRPGKWGRIIEQQLNSQQEQYLLLRTESIASMTLLLFVKKSQIHNVTHVSGASKKTGLGGITANKGACAVRFNFGATTFSLVTSHLAAGTNATMERLYDYQTIMSGLTFVRNMNIKDHDNIIWFGDLNYRISLMNEQCRDMVNNHQFEELYEHDQLNAEMNTKNGGFFSFEEGPIRFYPTYKFDKGTSNYDSSEKQRVPSWTDRIVYRSKKDSPPMTQLNYDCIMDMMLSDHKPIYSSFVSNVKFVDEAKKSRISESLYDQYRRDHGDNRTKPVFAGRSSTNSSTNSGTNFTTDALSELNLLDDFNTSAPPTPKRPVTTSGLPRRVPPPPSSRKASEVDVGTRANTLPRTLPPRPTDIELTPSSANSTKLESATPPAPPPARKVNVPVGFTSTPLIPSRSNSATPKVSPDSTGKQSQRESVTNLSQRERVTQKENPSPSSNSSKLTPMVPSKPSSLHSPKISPSTEHPPTIGANPQGSTPKPVPPTPPPRSNTANDRTMSDWKPLIPK